MTTSSDLPLSVTYDRYSLIINGKREFIRSGALHYFRLPGRDMWRDRLFKLKAAGYNTVDLYFYWGYHSSAPDQYDFTGIRDVSELLKITQELGLYVIARPGPYINAETSGGGFPHWLLAQRHLPLRNRKDGEFVWSEEYMAHVREWWRQIVPKVNASPNVILFQIENEYATSEMEPEPMRALYDLSRQLGVKVPIFHNDLYIAGLYDDIVDIYAFDNYSVTHFENDWRETPSVFQVLDGIEENLRPFCENRPLMAAELQAGWYGGWKAETYEHITTRLGREHLEVTTKSLLGQGLTLFNHYLAVGGTNWNRLGSTESYSSYDFAAPISETGLNTERLFAAKAMNQFLASFDFAATERMDTDDSLLPALSSIECLYAVRKSVSKEVVSSLAQTIWLFFRNLGQESQSVVIDERVTLFLKPTEVFILPWRLRLRSGYELDYSTGELVYQTDRLLVIRADRSVDLAIRANLQGGPAELFAGDESSLSIAEMTDADTGETCYQIRCDALSNAQFRRVILGQLTVLFLSARCVDTLWLEPDSSLVIGPEMQLPVGYASTGSQSLLRFDPSAGEASLIVSGKPVETPIAKVAAWQFWDDAPELNPVCRRDYPDCFDFQPISSDGADFDSNGIYEGSAWYQLRVSQEIAQSVPSTISIDARHHWAVFLNGHWIGHGENLILIAGQEASPQVDVKIPSGLWNPGELNEFLIFVTGVGHPKGFHDDAQTPQGLLTLLLDGKNCLQEVKILPQSHSQRVVSSSKPMLDRNAVLENMSDAPESTPIIHMETTFTVPDLPGTFTPWGLTLHSLGVERADLFLNGENIGRDWTEGSRQNRFYLPDGLLKRGAGQSNTLTLVLMNLSKPITRDMLLETPPNVTVQPYAVLGVTPSS